jgi:hypothetical protein
MHCCGAHAGGGILLNERVAEDGGMGLGGIVAKRIDMPRLGNLQRLGGR